MKSISMLTAIVSLFFISAVFAAEQPGAGMEELADGLQFTEGPAADAAGNIYFTDVPNNRIYKWSTEGELSTFMENSGGANGLFFDKDGNLIACQSGTGKVVSIAPDGTVTVLAAEYDGKPFNSPNDLWPDRKGGVYFSDPRYGSRDNLPQDGEHVYYIRPDRTVIRVIDDMVRPNGLIGTPDGKKLYVADAGANRTYVYTINDDGTLTDKKLFVEQGSDGVTLDAAGNVYLTGRGINVYNPAGERIRTIEPAQRPSNLTFGKDQQTLFITARTSFYKLAAPDSIYAFTVDSITGEPVSLAQYQGKVMLIVNTASKCGFTPQYAGLEQIYEKYKDDGLVVLGFPANNFASQEPGTNAEILDFCTTQYSVTFPMFSKVSVTGKDQHPLYAYLTSPKTNGKFAGPITWNFNKFLIGQDGQTLARYASNITPAAPEVTTAIESALAQ